MNNVSIKKSIWEFLKENKKSTIGYLFFSLAMPISNVYLPHVYGKIISNLNQNGLNSAVKKQLVYVVLLWILVQIFWGAMNTIDSYFIPKLRMHVRQHIVNVVLETYKVDYTEPELGGVLAEIVRLPDEIDHLFSSIRNHLLPMSYMLVFSIGYFMWTNPLIGFVSGTSILFYIFLGLQFGKKCVPAWEEMNYSHCELHDEINDVFTNLFNIYTSDTENQEKDRLAEKDNAFSNYHKKTIHCSGMFRFKLNMIYIALFALTNIVSLWLFSKGKIELNSVISVLIISLELVSKMSSFAGTMDKIMYELSVIRNAQRILDDLAVGKMMNTGLNKDISNFDATGDISFDNVTVKIADKIILNDVTLKFPKRETTVITGAIGSGKSTMVKCLMRLIPYKGIIKIGECDIQKPSLTQLRQEILFIPQTPKLFNRTVFENIIYGNDAKREHVEKLLEKYNLDKMFKLDQNVGKGGQSLSGGQRQIVFLLRCLFKTSSIIILDEPTASLDSETKETIFEILKELLKNKTVLLITHDNEMMGWGKYILNLNLI